MYHEVPFPVSETMVFIEKFGRTAVCCCCFQWDCWVHGVFWDNGTPCCVTLRGFSEERCIGTEHAWREDGGLHPTGVSPQGGSELPPGKMEVYGPRPSCSWLSEAVLLLLHVPSWWEPRHRPFVSSELQVFRCLFWVDPKLR